MSTLLIDSKADIAKAQAITQAIDNGLKLPPPTTGTRIYRCDRCQAKTPLTTPSKYAKGRVCADCNARLEWLSVLQLADAAPDYLHKCHTCHRYTMDIKSNRHALGVLVCDNCRGGDGIGYDPTCGLAQEEVFAFDLLMNTFASWVELEALVSIHLDSVNPATDDESVTVSLLRKKDAVEQGFNVAAHQYRNASTRSARVFFDYADIDMAWFSVSVWDWYQRWSYPIKLDSHSEEPSETWVQPEVTLEYSFTLDWLSRIHRFIASKQSANAPQTDKTAPISNEPPKAPVILPQALQSKEEALEAIAMSKLPVSPAKVDELVEAVRVAISEWSSNTDARILPDGYYLRCRPENAPIPTYVYLAHLNAPYSIVVGELSIMTSKDTHSELEFVSKRGEIHNMMIKVFDGPRQYIHPALKSWNVDPGGAA